MMSRPFKVGEGKKQLLFIRLKIRKTVFDGRVDADDFEIRDSIYCRIPQLFHQVVILLNIVGFKQDDIAAMGIKGFYIKEAIGNSRVFFEYIFLDAVEKLSPSFTT